MAGDKRSEGRRATCTAHARQPACPPTSNMPSSSSREVAAPAPAPAPAPSTALPHCRKTSGEEAAPAGEG